MNFRSPIPQTVTIANLIQDISHRTERKVLLIETSMKFNHQPMSMLQISEIIFFWHLKFNGVYYSFTRSDILSYPLSSMISVECQSSYLFHWKVWRHLETKEEAYKSIKHVNKFEANMSFGGGQAMKSRRGGKNKSLRTTNKSRAGSYVRI